MGQYREENACHGETAVVDSVEPEEIRGTLGISKKAFKRAVGALYRERRIRLGDSSIELADRSGSPRNSSA